MNVAAIGRRRFLFSLLLAYPPVLLAQGGKPGVRPVRVGILTSSSSDSELAPRRFVAAMQELGWTEGGNIAYEFVFADGDETRLPALAAQVVARKPDLIVVREQQTILEATARHRIAVVGYRSDFAENGALIAYGADLAEQALRCAHLADKVLRGMRPGDIPVEQPTRFELAVNLKTAKALGIEIPQSILLQANG